MSSEHLSSNPGAALLAQLKDLVDSFPEERRKEVIQVVRAVFKGLNSCHKPCDVGKGGDQQLAGKNTP